MEDVMLKKWMLVIFFWVNCLCLPPAFAAPFSYAKAVKLAAPAVVNVYTLRLSKQANSRWLDAHYIPRLGIPAKERRRLVLGSGVIMDQAGYVLTNEHVLRRRRKVWVSLSDGRTTEAQVLGVDPDTDLAVLRIHLKKIPKITVAKPKQLEVGDVVLAIGNPFGLGQTVTQGIVSALNRRAVGLGNIERYIQSDVALNPGSSGGALINAKGELVGINVGIYSHSGSYQGVSFAIPVASAEKVLHEIIRHGHVNRPAKAKARPRLKQGHWTPDAR